MRRKSLISGAEVFQTAKGGMNVGEQLICDRVQESARLSTFESMVGGVLIAAATARLRQLISEFLVSDGEDGLIAQFAAEFGDGVSLEEIQGNRLFDSE